MNLVPLVRKNELVETSIKRRVAQFLRQEREVKGLTLQKAAERFQLNVQDMWLWEVGYCTPQCQVFFHMVRDYGDAATDRAATLDLQFQLEKYHRLLKEAQIPIHRRPAMISRYAMAA
ncbi:MAG: hypothetical protein KF802_14800 [Bdellovibrionaceae bacterium]|nr:hypothetical protein [Pseudobdellovibrionaceae bacterium]